MLPAIDMINHATEPDKRNTLLRKSSAEVTAKVDGAPVTVKGFFTMKAGNHDAAPGCANWHQLDAVLYGKQPCFQQCRGSSLLAHTAFPARCGAGPVGCPNCYAP